MSRHLALHLLGLPQLKLDDVPVVVDRRKALALLAYLAVNRGTHQRDQVSGLLWPEYNQAKAFTNLRHLLWEVQQAIGEGWLISGRDTVGLIAETRSTTERAVWLDISAFRTLSAEGRAQKDVARRISLLTDSVKLYRNHFLSGFSLKDTPTFNEWAVTESEYLQHQLASVLSMLVEDLSSLKQAETAIPYGRRLIALDPLNEASHRQLMHVYIQAGQHSAALKQYQICEQILHKELGVDPQPETRALYKQIRKGEIRSTPVVKQAEKVTPQHNLPFQISSFIGRGKELDDIASLVADHRLVTLVGTGGIGKTRLSLKVGERLLSEYPNGIWLLELAPLSDAARVPQALAEVFGLVEGMEGSPTEKLVRLLRQKTTLLILDNCEHLLDACAQLTDTLLKNCPNLKILTTSRETLGITGEAVYQVPPLRLPDVQQFLETLLDFESIQLFEARARLVLGNFSLTLENAASVIQICRHVDGLPLAVELAAARVNMFSTEQIWTQLNKSFDVLVGGSRTALPRQQTLRASIEWSWKLLSEFEQAILRRLAVFAGGWTTDAAESVCSGNRIEPSQVTQALTQLVAKSLVVMNPETAGTSRYHLLEMIRQYAHEKLAETAEAEFINDQHLRYFLMLSQQIESELLGPQLVEWFARTNAERNNLRAALKHAFETDVEAGLYISSRLEHFWAKFDFREGARWLAAFLQKPEAQAHPHARAKALYAQSRLLFDLQHYHESQVAAEEALALFRLIGDQQGEVDSLISLGWIFTLGPIADPARGATVLEQALTLARSLGDVGRQAWALNVLGWDHRDYKRAFAYLEEAITLNRQVGYWGRLADNLSELAFFLLLNGEIEAAKKYLDESNTLYQQLKIQGFGSHLLSGYGEIALRQGDYEQARAYFQEDARQADEMGAIIGYHWIMARLGFAELRAGNITEARQIFVETAQDFQKAGSQSGVVYALEGMSSLYILVGKVEVGARLIGWTDATREVIQDTRPLLEQADIDQDIATIVGKMGRTAFQEAYNQGRDMSLEEAVAYVLGKE